MTEFILTHEQCQNHTHHFPHKLLQTPLPATMHYSVINEQFKILNSMQIHVQLHSHVTLLVTVYINRSVSESMSGSHDRGYTPGKFNSMCITCFHTQSESYWTKTSDIIPY